MTSMRSENYADATLADFGRDLWNGRVWIAAGLAVWRALAAVFLMLAVPRYYKAQMLAAVHQAADTSIREEGRARAGERAAQLQERLALTHNPAHRRTLTDLLMGQEQARMIWAIDQLFAAAIAEAPAAGARPHWLRKAVAVPVMMAGAFFGFALFSLRRRSA
jgi:hypothetical protein